MKTIFYVTLLASVATFTPVSADIVPVVATASSTSAISIVKQATLEQSKALKDIVKQMEEKREKIQDQLSVHEKKLKQKDQELVADATQKKLSEDAFAKKRQEFEKLVGDVRVKLELEKIRMELAFEEAKKKVYEAFLEVVESIRKTRGGIILYAETVAASDPSSDISNEVLEALDKKLSTVKVTFKSDAEIKKLMAQQQPAK